MKSPQLFTDAMEHATPPASVGALATLACLWEATAAKPGNVYRGADFDDLTYADFVTSAAVVGPILERATESGVGATVYEGVAATRRAVDSNTNLGILLLLAPLSACGAQLSRDSVADVLENLTPADAEQAYAAIRLAEPGGLGRVDQADVRQGQRPNLSLLQAMQLAADRDLIARQYANGFGEVFWTAERLARHAAQYSLHDAIVRAHVELMSRHPDSLICRKCGEAVAQEASQRAADVLAADDGASFRQALADLDFWLRSDGHRRNPGTSADLIAAGIFVGLRQGRFQWPVRFYEAPK